jgi:AraC-like DNA-binding protein
MVHKKKQLLQKRQGIVVEKTHEFPLHLDGYCYKYDKTKATMKLPHRHVELEFNLVVSGQARYVLEDRIYVLHTSTLSWLFPGQKHILVDVSDDYSEWVCYIRREFLRKVISDPSNLLLLEDNPRGFYCRKLSLQHALFLDGMMRDIAGAIAHADLLNVELTYTLLRAWAFFLDSDETNMGVKLHPAVEKAATLLTQTDEVELEEIAHQAGISHTHLCKLFRNEMGISMVHFRNRKRLERFLSLSKQKDINLMDAALEAGFGSYAQFYRVFRDEIGHSPKELLTSRFK